MAENEKTDSPLEGLTGRPIGYEDATWILTSAFIIFTMQSGFGLIESGMVTIKNETNIMVKNAIDIIFSGLSFWIVGFGLSFGVDEGTNAFTGVGYFMTEVPIDKGEVYAMYFFQMALASTATTIVSGAMAERTNLRAYMLYSFVSTLSTCFPTHWIWGKKGLLRELGVIDIAGCSGVHLVGGAAGLAAAVMLGPRLGRFDENKKRPQPCSMTNVLLGTFMLWWGWLGFNCGSTFGISGAKWKLASRSAVATLNGSIGGGILAIVYSYIQDSETLDVPTFVTGIRGGLVGVTGICALARPWEGLVIGFIGGLCACLLSDLMIKLKIDDPVNCVATHAGSAVWGMIAVALFVEQEKDEGFAHEQGLFKGGGWRLLGVQLLACVMSAAWGVVTTIMLLYVIEKTIGIRLTREEELQGCDLVEHGIGEDSENEFEEIDTEERRQERRSSSAKSASTAVDRFSGEEDEQRKSTEAFVLKLPMIARRIRRKRNNLQCTNSSEESLDDTRRHNEAQRASEERNRTCNTGAFVMNLPTIARNVRGKHGNKQLKNPKERTGDVSNETGGARNTGTSLMKLPTIACNFRRNHENKRCTDQESNAPNNSSSTETPGTSGTFLMKLPIITRNLRRKHGNKRSTNEESNASSIPIPPDMPGEEGDSQTSDETILARSISTPEIRDTRGANDLQSIYSMESDIEDFFRHEVKTNSETCYPITVHKKTEDKCVQVICEQGVLIEM